MKKESLVQPNRRLMFFETVEELQGELRVPDFPEVSAGYADIYHGIWINPQGQHVEVAIKELKDIIPRDRQDDPEALIGRKDIRMDREVFVWSQIKHPNLHPLIGYRSQPRPQLISPWCRHGNLSHYLRKNPSLSRLDKLRLIFQAACGLEHLHAQIPPICHADIKPENVLINDLFDVALSDFGLSRVLEGFGRPSGFTTSERVKGTLNYMAGELFTVEKSRSSLEADVYAFGGLILTVMSGKIPFHDLHEPAILFRVTNNQPPRREDHQDLPPSDSLWSLMDRCWSMAPEARPSMQEVLRELWRGLFKEESDFWSKLGLPLVSRNDGDGSSAIDLAVPGELPSGGVWALLAPDTPFRDDVQPGFRIAEETRGAVSQKVLDAALKTLETIKMDSRATPVIRRYIEAAVDVGSILLELAQTMDRNEAMANIIGWNAVRLAGHLEQLKEESIIGQEERLASLLSEVQRELGCTQRNIEEWRSSGLFLNAFSCCDDAEGRKICQGTTKKVLEEIRLLVALSATDLVTELKNAELQKEQRRLLDRLGDGNYGGKGNTMEDVTCLPGTRVDILEQIDDWVRGTSDPERALWIRGMAGRGKSTIASTVEHRWKFRASCAIFHFRRGQDALNTRLVCALARQLGASLVPEVKNAVLESLRQNSDILNDQLSEQFKTLLVASLGKLTDHSYPILLIVDALDECHEAKDVVDFVKLIHRHSSSFPANVKFLLTCRPDAPILRALEPNGWNQLDLDSAAEVLNDLARFIHHACVQIRNDHKLPGGWPSVGDTSRLVDLSQGLFQWARTALTYISNGSPVARLQGLLRRQAKWGGLDDLYNQILSKAMDNMRQDPEKRQLLCSVLGAIAVAPYPVSLEVIATLYGDIEIFEEMTPDNIIQFLRQDVLVDLNSLLHIPTSASESVRFMHTSIRDLLVSRERCQEMPYYVDATQHHRQLARLSLGLMLRLLKENICGLSDLSQAVSEIQEVAEREVPKALRYCCQAWSGHLTEGLRWSESESYDVKGQLDGFISFSQEKVLGWIEVMSVIDATSEGSKMAKQVYYWLSRCPSETFESRPLVNLWNDIHRFMTVFWEPISFGPLHIYASALPHCPWKTDLWRLYGSSAKVRILGGHQVATWPSNLWTRSIGRDPRHISFSGDGSLVITVSREGNVQFWETETGRQRGEMLGDSHSSICVVSPDSRILASVLRDSDDPIRLWDTQTGRQLGEPLTGRIKPVRWVRFSPDGGVLASASWDSIELWDTQTERQLGELMTGSIGSFDCVCFSPDGRVLTSTSQGSIRLWDTQTGRQLGEALTGHSRSVRCVCFSPDSRVLASGSWDNTIRLWDTQTGRQLAEPLVDHGHSITSICFSPDGAVLACVSSFTTIQLWDTQTGRQLGEPQTGHSLNVWSICFSPDGAVLASASMDKTIRLWDTQSGRQLGEPLVGHSDSVDSICFSPDGAVLASASRDKTIRLWDTQIARQLGEPLTGRSGIVACVSCSPDGKVLASGSRDTIGLWDTQTGRRLGELLIDRRSSVETLCFSPGGRILASGSVSDYEAPPIRLWDTQTWRQLGEPLTTYGHTVRRVCCSPDGRVLASASSDKTIRLWDTQTGRQLGERLTGHSGWVWCVCFSPNGGVLASGSGDKTIRLWDTQTGRQLGKPLTGHSSTVLCVCFSPCGRVLAAGSLDYTLSLWDTQTGRQLGKVTIGHLDWPESVIESGVESVNFTPDGVFLVVHQKSGACHIVDVRALQKCHPPPRIPSQIAIGFQDHWITHSSYRLLWLPAEYWTTERDLILLCNKTLAIAHGKLVSFFDLSRLPWSLDGTR